MAVTSKMFGNCLLKALSKEINLNSDVINVMLCTSAYVPDQDNHVYKSAVSNEVPAGNGYTSGGVTLQNKVLSYVGSTNTVKFDADDVQWPASTITARYAVIYDATPGTDATRPLIGYVDFGADVSSNNGTFQITWDANGIFNSVAS